MNRFFLTAALGLSAIGMLHAEAPLVSVVSATIEQGVESTLSICLNNGSMKVNTMGCNVYLPEGMEFVLTDGQITAELSDRKVDHTVSQALQTDGSGYYLVMSMTNSNIKGTEGVLFTTPVKVTGAPGEYRVMLNNIEVVDDALDAHRIDDDTYFTVTVTAAEEARYGDNQLYAKDITISEGENATLQLGYNVASEFYEYSATVVLPEGVTAGDVTFTTDQSIFSDYVNESSFAAPNLSISGEPKGRRDYAAAGDNIFATVALNTSSLPAGRYEIVVKDQAISTDADGDLTPDNYVAYLTVEGAAPSAVTLQHGVAYTGTTDAENVDVTYERTFAIDSWQPLYVPFNMSYDEWKDLADVAELACVHIYEDGRATIEFVTVTSCELLPNVPYVIKPKSTGAAVFECTGKSLKAAPADGSRYISCSSPRYEFRLYGNYQPISSSALASYGPSEYGGAYVMATGNKFGHASASATLKPFSFYIVRTRNENGYWGAPAAAPFKAPASDDLDEILLMVDGQVCGIADILTEDAATGEYYNLKGQKVTVPQHGIYIHNGKKVIVK